MTGPVAFSSDRFDMRWWTRDDVAVLHPVLGDPRVVFWDDEAGPIEHTAEILDRIVTASEDDEPGRGWFAVAERATGAVVGSVVVRTPTFDAAGVELGWHVRYDDWGRGIATEAAQAALAYAAGELGAEVLVAIILPDNHRSQRVAAKLGLECVGETIYKDLVHRLYRRRVSPDQP